MKESSIFINESSFADLTFNTSIFLCSNQKKKKEKKSFGNPFKGSY